MPLSIVLNVYLQMITFIRLLQVTWYYIFCHNVVGNISAADEDDEDLNNAMDDLRYVQQEEQR